MKSSSAFEEKHKIFNAAICIFFCIADANIMVTRIIDRQLNQIEVYHTVLFGPLSNPNAQSK